MGLLGACRNNGRLVYLTPVFWTHSKLLLPEAVNFRIIWDLAHFTWSHDIYHNRTAKCAPIQSSRIGHPSMSENYKNYTL